MAQNKPNQKFGWLDFLKINWFFLQDLKKPFVLWAVVLISISFAELIPPAIFGGILNAAISKNSELFFRLIIAYVIANTVIAIIRLTGKEKAGIIRAKTNQQVKILGFQQLLKHSILWHQKEDVGTKITRIEEAADAVETFQRNLYQQYYNVLKNSIGVLAIFLFTTPELAIIAIIYLIVFLGIQHFYNQKTVKLINQIQELKEAASGKFTESLSNILTAKAQSETFVKKNIEKAQALLTQKKIELLKFKNSKWKVFQTLNSITDGLVYASLGIKTIRGVISIGKFTMLAQYFSGLRNVMGQATVYYDDLLQMKQKVARLMSYFQEITDYPGHRKWPQNFNTIELKNIYFKLDHFELKNINLKIDRGQHVVIFGPSGGGKSTLLKLLLGLYIPTKGEYLIDGIPFLDIRATERAQKIAIVLQDVEVFNMSLKDNILLARDYKHELFQKAIRLSRLDEVINELPQKENTIIGEKGYKLSGGQKQRLALARAIYQNPDILILDEAFSNLQLDMAKAIIKDLKAQNYTIIHVTHNPALRKLADKQYRLSNGKISQS